MSLTNLTFWDGSNWVLSTGQSQTASIAPFGYLDRGAEIIASREPDFHWFRNYHELTPELMQISLPITIDDAIVKIDGMRDNTRKGLFKLELTATGFSIFKSFPVPEELEAYYLVSGHFYLHLLYVSEQYVLNPEGRSRRKPPYCLLCFSRDLPSSTSMPIKLASLLRSSFLIIPHLLEEVPGSKVHNPYINYNP